MDEILDIFIKLWADFKEGMPNVIIAIIIFILGWVIAKIVAVVVKNVLKGLKVDDLAEKLNEIDFIDKSNFKIVPSQIFSKIFYYIILLVFTTAATTKLGIQAVTDLVSQIITFIPNFIAAILVLGIGLFLADMLKNIVLTTTKSLGLPSASMIGGFVFYFVLIMAIITAVGQLGIGTEFISTNLSVIIGGAVLAFALGYGFASKDTMANFLASFYVKEKFRKGDIIKVEDVKGEILVMDSASVVLKTNEGSEVIVPLSKLVSEKVEVFKG